MSKPITYTTEVQLKGDRVVGRRWNVLTDIKPGALVRTEYGEYKYVEPGICGMLTVEDETGFQSYIPPTDVTGISEFKP